MDTVFLSGWFKGAERLFLSKSADDILLKTVFSLHVAGLPHGGRHANH